MVPALHDSEAAVTLTLVRSVTGAPAPSVTRHLSGIDRPAFATLTAVASTGWANPENV